MLYYQLAKIGAPAIGAPKKWPYFPKTPITKEALIALSCAMVRYDPRLLGILVIYFKERWQELNPLHLRREISNIGTPQTLGVIGEFVKRELRDREATYFFDYLTRGFRPVPEQLFFLGTYPFASRYLHEAAKKSLKEYKKWGFLSSEKPVVDLKTKRQVGSFDSTTRLKVLHALLKKKSTITLGQYLNAIDHSVSRQQALSDLSSVPKLKSYGRGRAAYWALKRAS